MCVLFLRKVGTVLRLRGQEGVGGQNQHTMGQRKGFLMAAFTSSWAWWETENSLQPPASPVLFGFSLAARAEGASSVLENSSLFSASLFSPLHRGAFIPACTEWSSSPRHCSPLDPGLLCVRDFRGFSHTLFQNRCRAKSTSPIPTEWRRQLVARDMAAVDTK